MKRVVIPILLFFLAVYVATASGQIIGAGSVSTGASNTFTALNKFTNGLEAYENNNANNADGVMIGASAGLNDVTNSVDIGFFARGGEAGNGGVPTGPNGVFIGRHAGFSYLGENAVVIGHAAGQYVRGSGDRSVILGYLAARNTSQTSNFHTFNSIIIGTSAFENGTSAQAAVAIGDSAAKGCTNGVQATIIGSQAGESATNCNHSILIGSQAGRTLSRNNTLVIESDDTIATGGRGGLLYGEFDNRVLRANATTFSTDGAISPLVTVTTDNTAGNLTYTAAMFKGGLILRDPNGSGRSDVSPTAALMLAALSGAEVGQAIRFTIRNTADAAETITMTAGAGATLSGTMTIAQNNSKTFLLVFTNVTASSEAYTLYSLGTYVH